MITQPSLFDPVASVRAKKNGMSRAEAHADPQWKLDMIEAIRTVASRHKFLTSDEVWQELSNSYVSSTHDPRAMGSIMKKAASLGLIVQTEQYLPSKRVVAHARPIRVWRSLVHSPQ